MKLEKDCVIVNRLGLHARPASLFVRTASSFSSEISVTDLSSMQTADGKSLMSMLSLGVPFGGQIRITVCGLDAETAMQALTSLIGGGFDE